VIPSKNIGCCFVEDRSGPKENMKECNSVIWQILDVGSIWMKEFASALSTLVPTVAWCPQMANFGAIENWQRDETLASPPLQITYFPLQRGYARVPFRNLVNFEDKIIQRMLARHPKPEAQTVICSTPYYAPLAEKWDGPVVYYVTDLTVRYEGVNPRQVKALDRRMCRVAQSVCPNSNRIAEYLIRDAGCDPGKITVVPNATRGSSVSASPLERPGAAPDDIQSLPRPIAGVIGNLSANMDWQLIQQAIQRTPYLSWVLVGPTSMPIADKEQREARAWTMKHATFTGAKPYGDLQAYARAFDVAILPYRKKEPTYSGSSTRFYEHLAACRPMIATRGFAELLEKPPLVTLVDTAAEMEQALEDLRSKDFADGYETARWSASKKGTWEERARMLIASVGNSVHASSGG
jgi:glycosyltransferase involved in cell wall biosynthesis